MKYLKTIIQYILNIFRPKKVLVTEVEAVASPLEQLDAAILLGMSVEDSLQRLSFALSQFSFKEDFDGVDDDRLRQLTEWNTRAAFAFSSMLDELKIIYSEQPKKQLGATQDEQ